MSNNYGNNTRFILGQQGFTLLEAIVALVLIATTGIALFDWINANLNSLRHIQQSQQRHEATRNALAFMETVNPQEKPQGEQTIGIYKFKWEAQTLKIPKGGKNTIGRMSIFEVGLYETEVTVMVKDNLLTRFNLRQVGYKQIYKFKEF